VATVAVGGCDLNIGNPNAPDAPRAFQDPAGLQQLLGGSFRTWVITRGDYYIMAPNMMGNNYTASWNNAAIRFYSSVGADCPQRCGWTNSSTADETAGGPTVESQWYGYYTMLSAASDVLSGVASGVCFDDDCAADNTNTSRNTAVAKMVQGMALSGIALFYDQGFVVDETTDLSDPLGLPFATRQEVRDAALQKFDEAYTEAGLHTWSTEPEWMGVGSGKSYTNTQIQQVIRTMEAELIAMFPRNATENAAADWAQVATYASQGISSGTPFDWEFYVDVTGSECGDLDCIKVWGNSIGTVRVDTRVAALLTSNHVDPWPEPDGNPCPTVSADKRVGDGGYGPTDDFSGFSTIAATANSGTDFACSGVPIFPPARGQYHQSNLQHVRYHQLGYGSFGEALPGDDGTGYDPMYTTQMNDLLWAEGLIRSGGSLAQAATLINNSRVTRGGLSVLTGAESTDSLIQDLQYEQEIEFMGQGSTPFFNRRRSGYNAASVGGSFPYVDGLIPGTPRHMPVPAKELDVLTRSVYTFGGPGAPDMVVSKDGVRRPTVRQRWEELRAMARSATRRF